MTNVASASPAVQTTHALWRSPCLKTDRIPVLQVGELSTIRESSDFRPGSRQVPGMAAPKTA